MTHQETTKILAVLAAAYPWRELDKTTILLYAQHLEDMPYAVAQAAATLAIDTCTYFPTIAELRRLATRLLITDKTPSPHEAWAEVARYLRDDHYHTFNEPTWSHDLIVQVLRALPWHQIWNNKTEPITHRTDRSLFLKIYQALYDRAIDTLTASPASRRLLQGLPALAPGQSFQDWPDLPEEIAQ